MARRYQRTDVRRRQIAEAALALIAERGLDGFTTRALGSRVGLTDGTIFRHFDSKAEIVLAALDVLEERMFAVVPDDPDPLIRLEAMFAHRARFVAGEALNVSLPSLIVGLANAGSVGSTEGLGSTELEGSGRAVVGSGVGTSTGARPRSPSSLSPRPLTTTKVAIAMKATSPASAKPALSNALRTCSRRSSSSVWRTDMARSLASATTNSTRLPTNASMSRWWRLTDRCSSCPPYAACW